MGCYIVLLNIVVKSADSDDDTLIATGSLKGAESDVSQWSVGYSCSIDIRKLYLPAGYWSLGFQLHILCQQNKVPVHKTQLTATQLQANPNCLRMRVVTRVVTTS